MEELRVCCTESSVKSEKNETSYINAYMGFPGGAVVKNPPASARDTRDLGSIPGLEDPLEQEMATHSSIAAWRIPRTEESSGLQGHRVGPGGACTCLT